MSKYKGIELIDSSDSSLAPGDSGNLSFRPSWGNNILHPGNKPLLAIYGTFSDCQIILKFKAPDNLWYDVNGIKIEDCGLYELPVNSNVEMSIDYTAGGSSSISAFVFHGEKPQE